MYMQENTVKLPYMTAPNFHDRPKLILLKNRWFLLCLKAGGFYYGDFFGGQNIKKACFRYLKFFFFRKHVFNDLTTKKQSPNKKPPVFKQN